MDSMLFWLAAKVILSYIMATSAFLMLWIFVKRFRSRAGQFLNNSNLILLFAILTNLVLVIWTAIECRVQQVQQLKDVISGDYPFYYGNCFSMLTWTAVLAAMFQFLFIKKHYRTRIWTTLVSLLLLGVYLNFETIYIILVSSYRDYVHSTWKFNYKDVKDEILTVLFSAVYFLVCWILPTRNDQDPFRNLA